MLAIWRSVQRFCPDGMIGRKIFLILTDDEDKRFFDHKERLPIHSLDSFIEEFPCI